MSASTVRFCLYVSMLLNCVLMFTVGVTASDAGRAEQLYQAKAADCQTTCASDRELMKAATASMNACHDTISAWNGIFTVQHRERDRILDTLWRAGQSSTMNTHEEGQ